MIQGRFIERRIWQLILIIADIFGLVGAFSLAQFIRFQNVDLNLFVKPLVTDYRFVGVAAIVLFSNYVFDLYEPRHWRSRLFSPLKILLATVTAVFLIFAWLYLITTETSGLTGRGVFFGAMALYFIYSSAIRYAVDKSERSRETKRRYLILASLNTFQHLKKDLIRIGIFDQFEHLDNTAHSFDKELKRLLVTDWTAVIIEGKFSKDSTKELMNARVKGQVLLSLQSFYEFYCGKVLASTLDDSWFAFTEGFSIIHSQTNMRLKRAFDIIVSVTMMLLLWPIMLLCWLIVSLESRGPALFSQVRVGLNGQPFTMWKFRSMQINSEKDGPQFALKKDVRVTFFGRFMRKVRLDELPQLWNILKGEMSFIGPRPERPEFVEIIRAKVPFFEFRNIVKPGLTGWAQVMYPYGATDEDHLEKVQFDLFYIKNYSFELDIQIIFKTIAVVLFGAGR